MTILQTKDGHLDIFNDLLSIKNELERFTDEIVGLPLISGKKLSEVVFGAEKIHVEFKPIENKRASGTLGDIKQGMVLQFTINT